MSARNSDVSILQPAERSFLFPFSIFTPPKQSFSIYYLPLFKTVDKQAYLGSKNTGGGIYPVAKPSYDYR